MKLTKQQLEYARQRVETAAAARVAKKIELLGPEPAGLSLSFAEKVDLIRSRRAVLRSVDQLNEYTDLDDAYTYPTFARELARRKAARVRWDARKAAARGAVEAEKQRVLDKLMLSGDGDEALQAIEAFAGT